MQNQTIKDELRSHGVAEDQLDVVIEDVMRTALSSAMSNYVLTLSPEVQQQVQGLSGEQFNSYLEAHKESLPQISQEMVDATIAAAWQEYFAAIA